MRAHVARTETYALEIEVFWGERDLIHSEQVCPAQPYHLRERAGTGPGFVVAPEWLESGDYELIALDGECVVVHGEREIRLCLGEATSVRVGPLEFRIRVVRPALPFAAPSLELKSQLWTVASFSAHAVALFCMALMPPKASSLSVDLMSRDDRYVRYLATPIETMDDLPWTQDVGARGAFEAKDDARAHRGDEGRAGKPEAKASDARLAIRGNAQVRVPAQSAAEHAKNAGILGILSAADYSGPTSMFSPGTPLGYDPETAQGALFGARLGENFGFNGLGVRGTGRSGGGELGDTIGVGQLETGQAARGTPGALTLAPPQRKERVPQRLRIGPVETAGSLSKEVIRRVIQRHLNEVRFCYEEGLRRQPELAGRVAVRFIVNPAGVVQQAQVANSELKNATTESCIASAVRRWTFPQPEGGGYVTVSYPFVFEGQL